MGKKPREKNPQVDEAAWAYKVNIVDQNYDLARLVIKCLTSIVCIGLASYFLSKAFGQSTNVKVSWVVEFLGDIKFKVSLALTGAATVWAIVERRLRKNVVKQFAPYKKSREEALDKNRLSSTISHDGTTSKKDRRQ
ncbi:hypothetical protein FKW31_10200 [Acetobacter sp. DmW_136]|uniref:hypothetical protein n=1 Tax=Acetobacter sp. DmW_136 TaxID=2591091 RepID=UPI00123A051E|nr:hypothetical protein [Acetobacter sp. DmW_136]KAA8385173.1 hypothetical protein FKW31_10200 [Acetobacter sp. DmW_136]